MQKTIFSVEAQTEARDFLIRSYIDGYEQGVNGQEYSGKTWLGYYGYLDGKEGIRARYTECDLSQASKIFVCKRNV